MDRPRLSTPFCLALFLCGKGLVAQNDPLLADTNSDVYSDVPKAAPALDASWKTRTEARTLSLGIPAPRGQIVDRRGYPLAQSSIRYRVAFEFPLFEDFTEAEVLAFAEQRVALARGRFGREWTVDPKRVLEHYKNRRWLPYLLRWALRDNEMKRAIGMEDEGLKLHPVYLRHYPQGKLASHVLGHVGLVRKLSTGPIEELDPMFEETIGREGLEKSYNEQLTGTFGEKNVLYDTDGTKLSEESLRRPIPGNNLVLTIDLDFQRYAEQALAKGCKSGAAVLLNARNGDILAIASRPSFDPGLYVDGIRPSDYNPMLQDPMKPLYPRAFSGGYPPASTFKIPVAMAALESGNVSPWSTYDCPPSLRIGDRSFKNWNKKHEGQLNAVGAIRRSCNTWFYQVAIRTGADPISSMANRLGYGMPVGLPIAGGTSGTMPTNEWSKEERGHALSHGDIANISIGQSNVAASPLQVARAMAAVGSGYYIPELRLVSQIQGLNDDVVAHFPPHPPVPLNVEEHTLKTVRQGMYEVVHAGNGTGKGASITYAKVAGKTGTAQWLRSEHRNLAWFAGYVPAENPQYAFAVVYEGAPWEEVSGGRKAAPIVRDLLTKVYSDIAEDPVGRDEVAPKVTKAPEPEETEEEPSLPPPPPRAISIDSFEETPRAEPFDPAPPVEEIPEKKKGLLNRLFKRR